MSKTGKWTAAEDRILKAQYSKKGAAFVAGKLNRKKSSVFYRARKLGLTNKQPRKYNPYSPQEIMFLKKYYPLKGGRFVAEKIGRSRLSVKTKARHLRIERRSQINWTGAEIEYLKKWYFKKKPSEIARRLKRSTPAVVTRARMIGLINRKTQTWTKYEEHFLLNNYKKMSYKEISKHLKRGYLSVMKKANHMRLKKLNRKSWTPKEKRLVSRYYNKWSISKLAAKLNRTKNSIRKQAAAKNLTKGNPPVYTDREIQFIKDNYLKMTNIKIGEKLNRPANGIAAIAKRLKLSGNPVKKKLWARFPKSTGKPYTKEEIEFIKKNYLKLSNKQIAEKLKRTDGAIQCKASKLGLTGNPVKMSLRGK